MKITFIDNRYGIAEINGTYAEIAQFLKEFDLEESTLKETKNIPSIYPNIPVTPNWTPDQPRPIEPWYVGDPIIQPYKITC